jgi:hypothetical protein
LYFSPFRQLAEPGGGLMKKREVKEKGRRLSIERLPFAVSRLPFHDCRLPIHDPSLINEET